MTISNRAPSFATACEWHNDAAKTANQWGRAYAGEVWNALTGQGGASAFAEAAAITMATEDAPLLYGNQGLPAAFALRCMHEAAGGRQLSDAMDGYELRQLAAEGWKTFNKLRANAEDLKTGTGADDSAAWEILKDTVEAGDTEYVAHIARIAGRMYESLKGFKVRVPANLPEDVTGIELGGDLHRILASELVQLDVPVLRDPAAMRIMQKRAMQFQMAGSKISNRGPLVILRDESGSMDDRGYYSRGGTHVGPNSWAAACTMTLARVAHEQNRKVRVVHFSTSTKAEELPIGNKRVLVQSCRTFLNGGTSIARALRRGIEQVGDLEKDGYKGADIVCITDGSSNDAPEQELAIDTMTEQGIKLWTVGIGIDYYADHPLRAKAEKYICVGNTNDSNIDGLEDAALSNAALAAKHAKTH